MRKLIAVGVSALALAVPSSAMASYRLNVGNFAANVSSTTQIAKGGTAVAINADNYAGNNTATANANATNTATTTQSVSQSFKVWHP